MIRLLVVIGLLMSSSSWAEEDAKTLWDRATAQFALGKYADAAGNFERVFELKPDPAILYNAAQARRLAGQKPRALELYTSYLRVYGDRIDNRAEVQRHVDNLKAAIAKDQQVQSTPPMTTKPPPSIEKTAPVVATAKPAKPAPATAAQKPAPVVEKPAPVAEKPAPVSVVAAAPAGADKPLIKKGWFWGVVVGAVAVVATGVALGVVFGTPDAKNPDPSFGTAKGN